MKLSMSNIAWNFDERLEAYEIIARHGLCAIEIAPGLLFADCDDPFEPPQSIVQSRQQELKSFGLAISSMQSLLFGRTGCALFGNQEERTRLKDGLQKSIVLASRLAVPNLVFGSPKARIIPENMNVEDAIETAVVFFRSLGEIAATYNSVIAMEANPKEYGTNFLTTYRESANFASKVNHAAIRVNFDVGSFILNKNVEGLNAAFEKGIDMIHHVHISEPFLALAPNEEHMSSVKSLIKQCQKLEYKRYISIEMRRPSNGLTGVNVSATRLSSVI